ncbi:MAG: hypothetical protein WCJ34_17695, partial [Alcaligenaceae bacterium]
RLDALSAENGREPNLAQLLLGHQGRLGWVQTLWLRKPTQSAGEVADEARAVAMPAATAQRAVFLESLLELASQLDQELKDILDPQAVFG